MLAASATPANSSGPAHDLGHQAFRIASPSQVMTMTTVIAENQVACGEVVCHGNARELLADAGVHGPKQFALGK
jgi:hypothetical protein